jgi:hypothetical protein
MWDISTSCKAGFLRYTTNQAEQEEKMFHHYTYEDALAASQKINWRVEDLIGGDKKLDFGKPFLPESFARTTPLGFLTRKERLVLNQIRGHGYLYVFGMVEEFILPFVLDHARENLQADDLRTRAFLGFAAEEAKHIDLFKRFRREFQADFGSECEVIGPPSDLAREILSHDPLAVALTILHIEWMTQRHYLESVKDDHDLDQQFKNLLRHHWMEEAQHAKLDTLMVEALAAKRADAAIERAVGEYLEIGNFIDGGLKQQAQFDLEALTRATRRPRTQTERAEFQAVQHQAQRWTFLGSGMSHHNFLATLEFLRPAARLQVEQASLAYS